MVVDLASLDVSKQVFVGCNAERGRTVAPFDLKRTAIRMNFGEIFNRPLVGHEVAVASDSLPVAPVNGQNHSGEERKVSFLHKRKCLSIGFDAGEAGFGFKKKL